MCACRTWPIAKENERKLAVLKRKLIRIDLKKMSEQVNKNEYAELKGVFGNTIQLER